MVVLVAAVEYWLLVAVVAYSCTGCTRAKSHASISVCMHSFVQALALEVTRWFLHF